jgi:hypothetical protein
MVGIREHSRDMGNMYTVSSEKFMGSDPLEGLRRWQDNIKIILEKWGVHVWTKFNRI